MDKYEYKVRADEIKDLIAQREYVQAAEIADTIDWRRVKSVMMLCRVSDVYKINRRYEDARNMLLLAYERRPGGRTICYSLCELSIKMEDFVSAVNYYKEFVQVAPKDSGRYILQYKLYEAQDVRLEERIGVLEELKKRDYREKWAYELAYLYHRVGLATRCVEECDELILWFGEGKYVIKAMELKMLHQPLNPSQQEKYDHRFDGYGQPGYEAQQEPGARSQSYYGVQPEPAYQGQPYYEGQPEPVYQGQPYYEGQPEPVPQEQLYYAAGQGTEPAYEVDGKTRVYGAVPDGSFPEQGYPAGQEIPVEQELFIDQEYPAGQDFPMNQEYPAGQDFPMNQEYPAGQDFPMNQEYPAGQDFPMNQEYPAGQQPAPKPGRAGVSEPPDEMDIQVKPMDMGQYNTINLQAEIAAGLKEVLEDDRKTGIGDEITRAIVAPLLEYETESLDLPEIDEVDENDLEPEAEVMEGSEVFFGETGELGDVQSAEQASFGKGAVREIVPEIGSVRQPVRETIREKDAVEVTVFAEDIAGETAEEVSEAEAVKKQPETKQSQVQQPDAGRPGTEQPDTTAETVMAQLKRESRAEEQVLTAQPPREIAGVLSQESDGQISFVVPESEQIEKQITGQMNLEDVLREWERMKQESAERRKEEVRQHVLRHTGEMFTAFEAAVRDGLLEQLEEDNAKEQQAADIPVGEADTAADEEPREDFREEAAEELPEDEYSEENEDWDSLPPDEPEEEPLEGSEELEEILREAEQEVVLGEAGGAADTEETETEESAEPEPETVEPEEPAEPEPEAAGVKEPAKPEPETAGAEEPVEPETVEAEEPAKPEPETVEAEEPVNQEPETAEEQEMPEPQPAGAEKAAETRPAEAEKTPAPQPGKAGKPAEQKKDSKADTTVEESGKASSVEREKGKLRSLTKEEKELYGPYIQSRASREQLVQAIDSISMAAYTGNIIITGEEGMDTVSLAKNMIREVQMADSNFAGKVAKISGQALNKKDVETTVNQMASGALIIQKASGMDQDTAKRLHKALQQESFGIIIILEDVKKAMTRFLEQHPDLAACFTARMDVESLSNGTLVAFGRKYAREREYSIDDMGILALHTRIDELQTIDHVVTVLEVKEIVDKAIDHANKKNLKHFFDILLARRYDEEDMIILSERDFV